MRPSLDRLGLLVDKKLYIGYNISVMENTKEKVPQDILDARELFTPENPHPSGAYWDKATLKWKGYKATKGVTPPWRPYNPEYRKGKVTINERRFLMVYSQTGNKIEAFKASYRYTQYPDKRIENARIAALAGQVLTRIKAKAPELVSAFTFDDMTPEYIKREYLKLYNHDHATIGEKRSILADMAKINAMFTEKIITDQKIREVVDPIYTESEEDFNSDKVDERKNAIEIAQA